MYRGHKLDFTIIITEKWYNLSTYRTICRAATATPSNTTASGRQDKQNDSDKPFRKTLIATYYNHNIYEQIRIKNRIILPTIELANERKSKSISRFQISVYRPPEVGSLCILIQSNHEFIFCSRRGNWLHSSKYSHHRGSRYVLVERCGYVSLSGWIGTECGLGIAFF